MLDSNGCGAASQESIANNHTKLSPGFGKDQIKWYKEVISDLIEVSPDTKLSMAFHIQISMFGDVKVLQYVKMSDGGDSNGS